MMRMTRSRDTTVTARRYTIAGGTLLNRIRFQEIRNNEEINAYIKSGNAVLGMLGYTDHSQAHAQKVALNAGCVMEELGYGEELIELAKISGYMHDIGNSINRNDHAHSGALMARQILKELGMHYSDIAMITSAIGHHDEKTGTAIHPVSAALILADKSDVHRNRVRNTVKENFDIHDRVNYAAIKSALRVEGKKPLSIWTSRWTNRSAPCWIISRYFCNA